MLLGVYPTPITRLPDALGPGRDLWVKRDDLTSPRYGGNKVRKLERVLDVALRANARRIVTVGAAGSHHVLATAIYARDVDIDVEAVLVPQPRTPHVVENLRATSARARVFPATSVAHAATLIVDRVACGAHYVPMGGSTREGVAAYADAAAELLEQVARGELPEPRVVVVALGSGGTAAGLTAGFARARSPVRVIGVTVTEPRRWVGQRARRMVRACLRDVAPRGAVGALEVNPRYLGAGYGHPTEEGARAVALGARYGLTLDDTYTGKAFAALQDLTANDDPVVFWDTLSSAPLAPFLEGAPSEEDLSLEVRALLLPHGEVEADPHGPLPSLTYPDSGGDRPR